MFKLIRQLVQKLNKDTKVETQHPSSHNNGKPHVVGSQSHTDNSQNRFCYDDNEKSYYDDIVKYGSDLSTKAD